jgi:hypothetical protein
MSYTFDSRLGEHLYQLMPQVYRTRDKHARQGQIESGSEDLARYLDAHGHLLDLIHKTLQQQLDDTLPKSSQEWLLPYFAQLLAVKFVSPDTDGRRAEVDNAVGWRQRKGTLECAEQIAEAVGQMEAEIQEGWQRVAMTPRIDMPLIPFEAVDDALAIDDSMPNQAMRHPSLPAAMVDFRRPSRAVEGDVSNPATRVSRFGGIEQTWRQMNRHGVPCFPGSFDDASRRTVDLRTPDAKHGRYHHKHLLAYVTPPTGLIPLEPVSLTWAQRLEPGFDHLIEEEVINGIHHIRNKTDRIVTIIDTVTLDAKSYRIENLNFNTNLVLASGGIADLHLVEARVLDVATPLTEKPVISASDCLFEVMTTGGHVELERCSVIEKAYLTSIKAIDCIFVDIEGTNITGVIEYSRIPDADVFSDEGMTLEDCTRDEAVFFTGQSELAAQAVLAPETPASIYKGASKGGEMGRFCNGRIGRAVKINLDPPDVLTLTISNENDFVLRDVIFMCDVVVSHGALELERVAAISLQFNVGPIFDDSGDEIPVLNAVDCLFDKLTVANGLTRLEYCSVMQQANCVRLEASDCIFVGIISDAAGGEPESGCIRYSRIPRGFGGVTLYVNTGRGGTDTRETPVFSRFHFCSDSDPVLRAANFGEPGYAVLDPSTVDAIRYGAEDGGEMGAGHHKYYSLKVEAVLDKMREFLPVGIEPVLIQDERLLHVPPEAKNLSNGGPS